ncbi:fatty acid--CoA ligase family protein [Leifsonia sp. 71-9]|uniref:ANL family adenylate-forming protein n=1 Tax=Leifsonia sp. 71-9 TaxID=1895934 RepID=UPI00092C6174|nr:fatty acid--CoA ligase family protein [Leifsonia sp. 71-9]OJX78465.1 MAG: o-succinylbenzoate--CoA ligase [Leifsonia sp. 71-9]
MTSPRIVPLRGPARTLLDRVGAVRAAGDVPLVGDDRAPESQWSTLVSVAEGAEAHPDAGWATLTSGSSGAPRIVQRTAASWADSFAAVAELLDAGADDAVALPAPPASSLTLFSFAHALAGGPRPVLPRDHVLTADDAAEATCFHGTPHALRALLDAGAPPRLRAALVGGSHLDPALRGRAEAAGIRVAAYYGAAELSYVAVDTGDGLRAFPGVELEVRDGELWVRSPFIALGYLGSAGGASAAGPLRRDGDWASVGDRAELVDGRLRLLGRADDAILSASATVVPEEVEAVLRTVPGVRDAVVFALPRERVGAFVAAVIEPEAGDGPSLAALRTAAEAQLAPAHRPRHWFAAPLPRTASGKPARAEAARRAAAGEVPRLG